MNDVFNLDDLDITNLELDDSEMDTTLEGLDLNSYDDVDEISEPHIKVDTKDFKEFLKNAKSVIVNNAKDIVSKSICLNVEEGQVVGYCTDFDVFLEYRMDLLNTDNILTEPISFPVDVMIKMMKAVPNTVTIFKDEEGFKLKLAGGSIPLETHNIDIAKYQFKDELKESEVSTMDSIKLHSILKNFTAIVTSAINPSERRIVFNEHGANAMYMFSMIKSDGSYPNMDIKIKDLSILKNLTSGKDVPLMFYDIADDTKSKRKVIKCDKFSYAFLVSELSLNKTLLDMEASLNKDDGLFIDFLQLYKLIELSYDLNYSLGKVGLNYTEDNKLKLLFKTKKGKDSEFDIDGTLSGNISPLKKDIEVPSKFLKTLLTSFNSESNIKISITDKALIVASDEYTGILFVEA